MFACCHCSAAPNDCVIQRSTVIILHVYINITDDTVTDNAVLTNLLVEVINFLLEFFVYF